MRLSKTSTALEVRAVLLKEGKSIAGWAREYGFNPVHAARYLLRWSDREKRPRYLAAWTGLYPCFLAHPAMVSPSFSRNALTSSAVLV